MYYLGRQNTQIIEFLLVSSEIYRKLLIES
jgi:hypothetical protein